MAENGMKTIFLYRSDATGTLEVSFCDEVSARKQISVHCFQQPPYPIFLKGGKGLAWDSLALFHFFQTSAFISIATRGYLSQVGE
jgi:hypothetical protein